ncbi:MAG: serine/threonine-protein kinase [Verrucomicrobiota bacterium]
MADRYQIIKKIGEGGVGSVYLAKDTSLSRRVAIKKLKPVTEEDDLEDSSSATHGTPDSLLKEAQTLSALQHPNIVTVFDVVEESEGPFVVMEYLSGETLERTIKKAALPIEDFFKLGIESLDALSAAHRQGILHRDIKPSNLMLSWNDKGQYRVKILDFGLAKLTRGPALQTMDQSGSILGTIHFMAPEQFERDLLDQRTDLYSLGCVLYYALSQKYPFDGETAAEVMASHLQHRCTPLRSLRPDVPLEVANWIESLIARNPDDRVTGSDEALEELKDLEGGFLADQLTVGPEIDEISHGPSGGQNDPAHTIQPSPLVSHSVSAEMTSSHQDPVLLPTVKLNPDLARSTSKGTKLSWIAASAIILVASFGYLGWRKLNQEASPVTSSRSTSSSEAISTIGPSVIEDSVMSPFDIDDLAGQMGQTVIVEGLIERAGESNSGKTRYLNFSWPPGGSVPVAMSINSENDGEFSMDRLENLAGKTIRAEGEIESVFGKPQLKLRSWSDLEIIP